MTIFGNMAAGCFLLMIILSQENTFHQKIAAKSAQSIEDQWRQNRECFAKPKIIQSHKLSENVSMSSWTVFSLFEIIEKELNEDPHVEFVGIINENTQVNLTNLVDFLKFYRDRIPTYSVYGDKVFLGRGLKLDKDAALFTGLLHKLEKFQHSEAEVLYPDMDAGIFMSKSLLKHITNNLDTEEKQFMKNRKIRIHPNYQIAELVFERGLGVPLSHVEEICGHVEDEDVGKCLAYPRDEYQCLKGKTTDKYEEVLDQTFFAVTTCKKYHHTRVKFVKETWGKYAKHIQFFSEVEDPDVPSVRLKLSSYALSGHCKKTMAILHHFLALGPKFKWLVSLDDDTILSVSLLTSLLACYNNEDAVYLGERFGSSTAQDQGYNYIAGGAGIVVSRAALKKFLSIPGSCECPSPTTPEDMHLGKCATNSKTPPTHSYRFHQARPGDYPMSRLAYQTPVTFHKHWEVDPYQVYQDWFRKYDEATFRENPHTQMVKDEDETDKKANEAGEEYSEKSMKEKEEL